MIKAVKLAVSMKAGVETEKSINALKQQIEQSCSYLPKPRNHDCFTYSSFEDSNQKTLQRDVRVANDIQIPYNEYTWPKRETLRQVIEPQEHDDLQHRVFYS